jgi:hypothetical protein
VLVGRVTKRGRTLSVRIIVRGERAERLAAATFYARNAKALGRAVEGGLWKRFGHVLAPSRSGAPQARLAKPPSGVSRTRA